MLNLCWKEIENNAWISEPNIPRFQDVDGRIFILCQSIQNPSGNVVLEPIKESFGLKLT